MADKGSVHRCEVVSLEGRKGNLQVTVDFTYLPSIEATEFEPPCDAELDIHAVWLDDYDILHIIGENTFERIEQELYKIINKGEV